MKPLWHQDGEDFMLGYPTNEQSKLPNHVFVVKFTDRKGFFLERITKKFNFDYKIYGLEEDFIKRVVKTFNSDSKNLGILMNGTRGTGKTVSSKIICNELQKPVIIINQPFPGIELFINSIQQDIVIFVDEYEKIYEKSRSLLTIMDGALNSNHKRGFILTTNNLYVEENMLQRPSRIRYLKEFGDLNASIVKEIVDDILEFPRFKEDLLKFISGLSMITVDIVKSVVDEVNLHEESPFVFEKIFNVKKIENGSKIVDITDTNKPYIVGNNIDISARLPLTIEHEGNWLEINHYYIGKISKVLDDYTAEIEINLHGQQDRTICKRIFSFEKTFRYNSKYGYGGQEDKKFASEMVLNQEKFWFDRGLLEVVGEGVNASYCLPSELDGFLVEYEEERRYEKEKRRYEKDEEERIYEKEKKYNENLSSMNQPIKATSVDMNFDLMNIKS